MGYGLLMAEKSMAGNNNKQIYLRMESVVFEVAARPTTTAHLSF